MVLTDCDKIPMCPEGYKELTSAHGNVSLTSKSGMLSQVPACSEE